MSTKTIIAKENECRKAFQIKQIDFQEGGVKCLLWNLYNTFLIVSIIASLSYMLLLQSAVVTNNDIGLNLNIVSGVLVIGRVILLLFEKNETHKIGKIISGIGLLMTGVLLLTISILMKIYL